MVAREERMCILPKENILYHFIWSTGMYGHLGITTTVAAFIWAPGKRLSLSIRHGLDGRMEACGGEGLGAGGEKRELQG